MSMPPPFGPSPAWYPDPKNEQNWRYWDGSAWSDHLAPRSLPVPPSPAPNHLSAPAQIDQPPAAKRRVPTWVYPTPFVTVIVILLVISHSRESSPRKLPRGTCDSTPAMSGVHEIAARGVALAARAQTNPGA
jgi:hypothetical protein